MVHENLGSLTTRDVVSITVCVRKSTTFMGNINNLFSCGCHCGERLLSAVEIGSEYKLVERVHIAHVLAEEDGSSILDDEADAGRVEGFILETSDQGFGHERNDIRSGLLEPQGGNLQKQRIEDMNMKFTMKVSQV